MADVTKSSTTFKEWAVGAIALEETKRGLGKVFHRAVMELLSENPGKTPKELSAIYTEALKVLANELTVELDGASLNEALPSFRQYLSDYKRGLELLGYDLRKCGGIADVKKAKADVAAAMKEKESGGVSDDTSKPGDNGGGKPEVKTEAVNDPGLPEDIRNKLNNAIEALSKMNEAEAKELVNAFHNQVWAKMRKGNKKMGVAGARHSAA